jgi:ribonuclease T1
MMKSYGQLLAGILVGLVCGFLLGKQVGGQGSQGPAVPPSRQAADRAVTTRRAETGGTVSGVTVPAQVYTVLQYIRAHNAAMQGYVGGRIFANREERLPREDNHAQPILYHEWDVHPKVPGQNRGTERIITGSDGRAWYSNDHYQTFTEIKGP